jgi:hypothetical protein
MKLGRSPRRARETSQCSQPAGGDLGGRPWVRPALGWTAPGRAMYRRDAGLRPRSHPSWAAPWRDATGLPAMRVLGRGGGRGRLRRSRRPGRRGLREEAVRRCLTQRGELQRRVDGVAHQLAERALGRAAGCGQRGEHVFVKLRIGSDGTPQRADSAELRMPVNRASARFARTPAATDLAGRQNGPASYRSVDQISTLVRTFSITASVNSVVVEWPPRSIVFTPPAVVSSTLS